MGGGEIYYNEDGLPMQMRRSRRSVGEPQRLAPSWGEEDETERQPGGDKPAGKGAGGAGGGAAKGGKSDQWSRAQLNALFSGLFAFGHGRTSAVHDSHAALATRTAAEVDVALEYTVALALRTAARQLADDGNDDGSGDEASPSKGGGPEAEEGLVVDTERLARSWHFLQTGRAPASAEAAAALELPASVSGAIDAKQPASWYENRIASQGRKLTAQLIDLRRLRAAVEAAPFKLPVTEPPVSAFEAPRLPPKFARPTLIYAGANLPTEAQGGGGSEGGGVCELDDEDDDAPMADANAANAASTAEPAAANAADGEGSAEQPDAPPRTDAPKLREWTHAEDTESPRRLPPWVRQLAGHLP